MSIANLTTLEANALVAGDAGSGGRGSITDRGFDTTLSLISRLESVTLSMLESIQVTNRVWEWEIDALRSPFLNANSGFTVADYSSGGPTNFTPTARTLLQNYSQVYIRQIVTEGTLRREETNTGDEQSYQTEVKETLAIGRDMNSTLLCNCTVQGLTGTTSNRVSGGIAAYAGGVYLGGGAPGSGGSAAVWNWQTVAYSQAASGGAITATGTTTGSAITNNAYVNRLSIGVGNPGYVGASVPVMTTAATAGTGGYITNPFSRRLLSSALSSQFDAGGTPTNVVTSPGLRAVFTELTSRQGNNDIYRINMDSNETIRNSTSVFLSDFGYRLRIDTDQQLRNYTTASGGSPGAVPSLGSENPAARMIAFNPASIKIGVVLPLTRTDQIPQPIYGASSALVAEQTLVVYNPVDILDIRNLNPDISSAQYT